MLTKEHLSVIQEVVDKEVAEYLRDLPQKVKDILRGATIAMMGLEHDPWGRARKLKYKVVKEGGWLPRFLDEAIRKYVAKDIEPALKAIRTPSVQAIIDAGGSYFQDQYKYEFRDVLRNGLKDLARKNAEKVLEQVESALSEGKSLADLNFDIEDPDSFPGATGEVLLEIEAKKLVQ